MNEVPRDLYVDLAGLADFEIEAGRPMAWPSYAQLHHLRRVEDAPWRPDTKPWLSLDGLIVRWGDPRINQIMEFWRDICEQYESGLRSERPNDSYAEWEARERRQSLYWLHGKRLIVILPTMIYTTHIIPKVLGIPDPDDDEGGMISQVFDPMIYHHDRAKVFGWDMRADTADDFLKVTFGSGPMVYLDVEEYCLQLEFGLPIDRTILPTVAQQTDGEEVELGARVIRMA